MLIATLAKSIVNTVLSQLHDKQQSAAAWAQLTCQSQRLQISAAFKQWSQIQHELV